MNARHNPSTVAPPFGAYSHAIEVPPGARWLYVSGQVGVQPDGTLGADAAAQIEWAFRNLVAVLEAAGMGAAVAPGKGAGHRRRPAGLDAGPGGRPRLARLAG
jgi:enamine deaminase RidA (YjgF/YER057c/UK114 family)